MAIRWRRVKADNPFPTRVPLLLWRKGDAPVLVALEWHEGELVTVAPFGDVPDDFDAYAFEWWATVEVPGDDYRNDIGLVPKPRGSG